MIEVSRITKRYGTRTAVDDLSFTMEKGKVYGFLGPNGAGKSTTMNIVTGYIAPTSGSVTICGFDMAKDPEQAKRHIGYLPEIPPLYPEMTVTEYLSFVAELKGVEKKARRDQIARILKMTGLGAHAGRMIRPLSKGYKQRVGMAQALVGFPEVLIFDEPTAGLDPQQIKEVREMIASLREGHIVVLSSHILSEVSAVCDEMLIIARGKKKAQGTAQELMRLYGDADMIQIRIPDDHSGDLAARAKHALRDAGIAQAKIVTAADSLEEIFLKVTAESSDLQTADAGGDA